MKKVSILILSMFLLSFTIKAQAYLNLEVIPKVAKNFQSGLGFQVGVLAEKTEVFVGFKSGLSNNKAWTIWSLNVGRQIMLSNYETQDPSDYSITPSIGYAFLLRKNFETYDADHTGMTAIERVTDFKPMYNLEIGKDGYYARVCLNLHYCTSAYVGISFKMFINRD